MIALNQTLKELNRMGDIASSTLKRSLDAFFNRDEQKARRVLDIEKTVDYLSHNITHYMIEFRGLDLSAHDLKVLGSLHHVIIDMERIGDLAENIAEFSMTLFEQRAKMSPEAEAELSEMAKKTMDTVRASLDAFERRDKSRLPIVDALEQEVDIMRKSFINSHVDRLQEKTCNPQTGVIFTNMVATLERVADHATNIAFSIIND